MSIRTQVTVSMPDDVLTVLHEQARQQDRPISRIVVEALRAHLGVPVRSASSSSQPTTKRVRAPRRG